MAKFNYQVCFFRQNPLFTNVFDKHPKNKRFAVSLINFPDKESAQQYALFIQSRKYPQCKIDIGFNDSETNNTKTWLFNNEYDKLQSYKNEMKKLENAGYFDINKN